MAYWWQHTNHPNDPRYYPAPVPTAGVFDEPQVAIVLNQQWLAHIDGLLSRLLIEDAWLGTDDDVQFAIGEVNKLLARLEATLKDETVKITADDTTPGYLIDKLLAGSRISLTKNNAGANETLTADVTGLQSGDIGNFTEAAQDAIGSLLAAGANISVTYNDAANTLTIAVTGLNSGNISDFTEAAQDATGALLAAGANVTLNYNDAANTLTISVSGLTSAAISDFAEAVDDRVAVLIVAGDGITKTYDDAANTLTLSAAVLPIGMIAHFAQSDAGVPAKWLWCGGQAVSRATYALLFAVIGTHYGAGNGTTTFNVPDLRSNFIWHTTTQNPATLGATGGEANHTLTTAELPAHTHPPAAGISYVMRANAGGTGFTPGAGASVPTVPSSTNTGSTGTGDAHNNIPPYLILTPAIYAGA